MFVNKCLLTNVNNIYNIYNIYIPYFYINFCGNFLWKICIFYVEKCLLTVC